MDMNQCKPGDKLLLRNNEIATYLIKVCGDTINEYPHIIMLDETKNEVSISNEGYVIWPTEDLHDVVSILDFKNLLKEAFDAGAEYMSERNYIDPEGYMDFHEDYEIEAPNFDNWYTNNAFKLTKIK